MPLTEKRHQGERLAIFLSFWEKFHDPKDLAGRNALVRRRRSLPANSRVLDWEFLRLRSCLTPLRMTEVWEAVALEETQFPLYKAVQFHSLSFPKLSWRNWQTRTAQDRMG